MAVFTQPGVLGINLTMYQAVVATGPAAPTYSPIIMTTPVFYVAMESRAVAGVLAWNPAGKGGSPPVQYWCEE